MTANIIEHTIKTFVESLRPNDPEIRKEIDYGYTYDGAVIILHEIRPVWNMPSRIQQLEFAKLRYYKTRKEWNLYWLRGNGKWELYYPDPDSPHLGYLLQAIKNDEMGCFFG